jgi:fused signal recognition particle receptor
MISWFDKLKKGLSKSSSAISNSISQIISKKKLDENTLEELEDLLISADIGVETASLLVKKLAKEKFNKEVSTIEVKEFLANIITETLSTHKHDFKFDKKPHVILVCGVNGNGKTTSIGKLAHYFKQQNKKVLLAACDTFRAAATEQLQIWAQNCGCEIVIGENNSDPASVAYKAYNKAIDENFDILLIDTAGRLHNKINLMSELEKISRVLSKNDPSSPHETILVLDGTTGQNAISQVEKFNQSVKLTSLIITKLDGTAKAGIVVALINKFKIPISAIGIGENIEDLRPFIAKDFAHNLIGLHNDK